MKLNKKSLVENDLERVRNPCLALQALWNEGINLNLLLQGMGWGVTGIGVKKRNGIESWEKDNYK